MIVVIINLLFLEIVDIVVWIWMVLFFCRDWGFWFFCLGVGYLDGECSILCFFLIVLCLNFLREENICWYFIDD